MSWGVEHNDIGELVTNGLWDPQGPGWGEVRLQLMFYCSSRGDPKNWVWGNRENGEGPWVAYLVFWKSWYMAEQGVSA